MMPEEHMAMRAALEKRVEVRDEAGVERGSVRASERHLETLVGRVAIPRQAYQAPGQQGLHPMGRGPESGAGAIFSWPPVWSTRESRYDPLHARDRVAGATGGRRCLTMSKKHPPSPMTRPMPTASPASRIVTP